MWYKMKDSVSNWCQKCQVCAKKKYPSKKNRGTLRQYHVGSPLERVCIDILGPLPRTSSGNKYILVVTDSFSKWADGYAMPNQEAITVATKLVENFITKIGVPMQIHSDQGTQFQAQLFQEMCRLLDIKKSRTTAFHPESNGIPERFNRTLETMLSSFVSTNQKDWDKHLPYLLMAYRATPHETTQTSPNSLMFGREVYLPVDIMIGRPQADQEEVSHTEYAYELHEKLENAFDKAREHTKKNASRQKRNYDLKVAGKELNEGEWVWLENTARKIGISPKLQHSWDGPFLITKKVNDVIYQLRKKNNTIKTVHFNRLKKCQVNKEDGSLGCVNP